MTGRHEMVYEVPAHQKAVEQGRLRTLGYPPASIVSVRTGRITLEFRSYPGSVAIPLRDHGPQPKLRNIGAVYDRDGALVVDSQRAVRMRSWRNNPPVRSGPVAGSASTEPMLLTGRSFFAGHYSPGFGHVLLETLARFWRPEDYGAYDQIVCYRRRADVAFADIDLLSTLLGCLGASASQLLLLPDSEVRFETLDVSTSPFVLKWMADPRFLDAFERIARCVSPPAQRSATPARVYLSRSRLGRGRRATNEAQIESLMIANGFSVEHPQELPFARQVELMSGADVIAGCDGSALHLAVFARAGTRLLAIDSRQVPSQFVIDRVRGLDALHVLALDEGTASRVALWEADIDRVERGLEVLLGTATG